MDKFIQCPFCKKDLVVTWASFIGTGKKCPYCQKVITNQNVKVIYK